MATDSLGAFNERADATSGTIRSAHCLTRKDTVLYWFEIKPLRHQGVQPSADRRVRRHLAGPVPGARRAPSPRRIRRPILSITGHACATPPSDWQLPPCSGTGLRALGHGHTNRPVCQPTTLGSPATTAASRTRASRRSTPARPVVGGGAHLAHCAVGPPRMGSFQAFAGTHGRDVPRPPLTGPTAPWWPAFLDADWSRYRRLVLSARQTSYISASAIWGRASLVAARGGGQFSSHTPTRRCR